jgi:hypothetical protein
VLLQPSVARGNFLCLARWKNQPNYTLPDDLQHSNPSHCILDGRLATVRSRGRPSRAELLSAYILREPCDGLACDRLVASILLPCNLRSSSDLHTLTDHRE